MINKDKAIQALTNFANSKLESLGKNNPVFNIFVQPYMERVINANISKIDKALTFIADEKGMVDIDGLINDITDKLVVSELNKFNGITIGNGQIVIDIPGMNKSIVFTTEDFKELHSNLNKYAMLERSNERI